MFERLIDFASCFRPTDRAPAQVAQADAEPINPENLRHRLRELSPAPTPQARTVGDEVYNQEFGLALRAAAREVRNSRVLRDFGEESRAASAFEQRHPTSLHVEQPELFWVRAAEPEALRSLPLSVQLGRKVVTCVPGANDSDRSISDIICDGKRIGHGYTVHGGENRDSANFDSVAGIVLLIRNSSLDE